LWRNEDSILEITVVVLDEEPMMWAGVVEDADEGGADA
jgi:hypothetical protein